MAITYANTNEIENISKDISRLATEFETEINSLFFKFSEVPNITKEWVGTQAEYYFNTISYEKKQYTEFAQRIRDFSNKLNNDANEIQGCINRTYKSEQEDTYL